MDEVMDLAEELLEVLEESDASYIAKIAALSTAITELLAKGNLPNTI